jgi:hypothetical protein
LETAIAYSTSKKVKYVAGNDIIQEDVDRLGNIYNLDLRSNDCITDVSALGNVHTLNLSRCQGITDVSALGNVKELNL